MKYVGIKCTHCAQVNRVPVNGDITCSECGKSVFKTPGRAKKKKGGVFLLSAAAITAIALNFNKISPAIEAQLTDRYPMSLEFEIIDRCIGTFMNKSDIFEHLIEWKRKYCICSLEKTQKKYDYEAFQSNGAAAFDELDNNIYVCIKEDLPETGRPLLRKK